MFHPDCASTIEQYKQKFPDNNHALLVVATSYMGEIIWAYFDGNSDRGSIANAITSFVYVNEWKISIEQIKLY